MKYRIPFNKPYLTGNEMQYMHDAVEIGKISGNGKYTELCQKFFEEKYGIGKCLLTTSCTDALEMAAILLDIKDGDEVIMPSYTFVSTANAFILRGGVVKFIDSKDNHPGMDESKIVECITPKTKAIVPVHYAGIACDMDKIMEIAESYNLFVVEDAAQAVDSFYTDKTGKKRALGSIGHLSTFSFHETKNIISGEGGMLGINDSRFFERAEIIWEKGTNRAAFFKGEIDKYGWVDIGSSFLPSELIAAFLWAQLESLEEIQKRRKDLWNLYHNKLSKFSDEHGIELPYIPNYATNNAHMFFVVTKNIEQRSALIKSLKERQILAVFHYLSLHSSKFYSGIHGNRPLLNTEKYSNRLLRLPLYFELSKEDINTIVSILQKA